MIVPQSTTSLISQRLDPSLREVYATAFKRLLEFNNIFRARIPVDSVDLEVVRSALKWTESGHRATLGTVVHTWGSAPRPVGAMLVIRDDGQVIGSVSGGCVEDDLIDKVRTNLLGATKPTITTYGVTQEQATRFGLPCGGTLQLVLEPVAPQSKLDELLKTIERHELVARFLDMETG